MVPGDELTSSEILGEATGVSVELFEETGAKLVFGEPALALKLVDTKALARDEGAVPVPLFGVPELDSLKERLTVSVKDSFWLREVIELDISDALGVSLSMELI